MNVPPCPELGPGLVVEPEHLPVKDGVHELGGLDDEDEDVLLRVGEAADVGGDGDGGVLGQLAPDGRHRVVVVHHRRLAQGHLRHQPECFLVDFLQTAI